MSKNLTTHLIKQLKYIYLFSFHLVTSQNYEGVWIETPGEKILQCYKQNETTLSCEYDNCISNCHDYYGIQGDELIYHRDSNVIGHYNRRNEIRWGNHKNWTTKGAYSRLR